MVTLFSLLAFGFLLGMRHATDADHVVAVTTILSREGSMKKAAWVGALWGIGHTMTLLVVGGAMIIFNIMVPTKLGQSLEMCVAAMLVLLGIWNYRKGLSADHVTDNSSLEAHVHDHTHAGLLQVLSGSGRVAQTVRPIAIGIVHGLAGSAAVALLVLPFVHNALLSAAYLITFGIGTIAGMMVITSTFAVPVKLGRRHSQDWGRYIGFGASLLSIGFGVFLFYQIGFVDGLFR